MLETYYRLLYRLDGSDGFLIWFEGEAATDGVLITPDGRMVSFLTREALDVYAQRHGVELAQSALILHDLDALEHWMKNAKPESIDCSVILSSWNLFVDVARSVVESGADFLEQEGKLNAIYDKIFWGNNLPSVTPEGREYCPIWSADEVSCLAEIMASGLALFRKLRINVN